jgi:hypothetical protein
MKTERQILERLVESYQENRCCYYPSGIYSSIVAAAELLNIELAATDSQQLKAVIGPCGEKVRCADPATTDFENTLCATCNYGPTTAV